VKSSYCPRLAVVSATTVLGPFGETSEHRPERGLVFEVAGQFKIQSLIVVGLW